MNAPLSNPIFRLIGQTAAECGCRAYVIGGFVRDCLLGRPLGDIDVVVTGSGIEVAERLGKKVRAKVSVFKNFGTASLKTKGLELEFVGARKESYRADSRNPSVECGSLEDDQNRRDFTINAMAFSLNDDDFGTLVDPFDGMSDLQNGIIRTPLDPDTTFSDDPLRMVRAIRFATQLDMRITDECMESIRRNRERIAIISRERITTETRKIICSSTPSRGFFLFDKTGLLELIYPDLHRLKGVEKRDGRAHKDNFIHTLKVLDNVARSGGDEWLRWAALLHDIAKPRTKAWDNRIGWTFHNHEFVGSRMVRGIFNAWRLPLDHKMKFVEKMVLLHLRPIVLADEGVTDSAVRRLLFDAGDDTEALMTLCRADITSGNGEKVARYLRNFDLVEQKMRQIEEKDRIRNFQPPITGQMIMQTYGLPPCAEVGQIKNAIKDAILDGVIDNDYSQAYELMVKIAAEIIPDKKPLP
ncbi:MAG: CCA tRNA nucleotidyltransferase [Rikenellaceae bacterium]|nr:CCA tRNA nucleotidyltransferase [Rikenellaceae bacterium]